MKCMLAASGTGALPRARPSPRASGERERTARDSLVARTSAMNGAGVVAEILKREGTEFLACYPRNPLIEACAALNIRPILCRQERVGVGLADG